MARGAGGAGWSKIGLGLGARAMDHLEGIGPEVPLPERLWIGHFDVRAEDPAQTSDNHEAELAAAQAVVAADTGSGGQWERAKEILAESYFARELRTLWGSETMAPDNHSHQHLQGTSLSRVAVIRAKQRFGDAELLGLSNRLMRATVGALRAVATPDLQVWSAGTRPVRDRSTGAYLAPLASASSAWLRYVLTGDHGLPSLHGKRAAEAWRDPGMGFLRGLRWLLARGDALGGAREAPIAPCGLKWPLTVYRGDDAHLSILHVPDPSGVTTWCLVPYAARRRWWNRKTDEATAEVVSFDVGGVEPLPPPPRGSYPLQFTRGGSP